MGLDHVRVRNTEAAVRAYRKAIEQRGGYYPEAHQDLGRVLYSMGDLSAANEEYSIAVRQKTPKQAEAAAQSEAHAHAATGKAKKSRRSEATEELGTALRQAPATADLGIGTETISERVRETTGLSASNEGNYPDA